MIKLFEALPWIFFWLFANLFLWVQHTQYMAGHETSLFVHRTPAELRIRDALVMKAEAEAAAAVVKINR